MLRKTYYQIADIIQRNRTWIKVIDTEKKVEMRIFQDGVLKTLQLQALTLQSFREHYGIQRTRTWNINEYDLGRDWHPCARMTLLPSSVSNRICSLFVMWSISLKKPHSE